MLFPSLDREQSRWFLVTLSCSQEHPAPQVDFPDGSDLQGS